MGRVKEMQTLYSTGYNLSEIAAAYGVTRERVRQILNKYGRPEQPADIDPAKVLTAIRAGGSWARVAKSAGKPVQAVVECAKELGVYEAAERLWKWRKGAKARRRRASLIAQLQQIAALKGREPLVDDVNELMDIRSYQYTFGTWNNALEAAGFNRHPVGTYVSPGKRKGWGTKGWAANGMKCKRGHDVTLPGGIYMSPKGHHACAVCSRGRWQRSRKKKAMLKKVAKSLLETFDLNLD